MQRLLYTLLTLAILLSCQEENLVNPTASAGPSRIQLHDKIGLSDPNGTKFRITPQTGIAYTAANYTVEELYISKNNALYAVDATTGSGYALNSDMPFVKGMTSYGGMIYLVANDNLYKVDPATGVFTPIGSGWTNTDALTAGRKTIIIKGQPTQYRAYIFGKQNGTLWRHDLVTNTRIALSTGWTGTGAITTDPNLASQVFLVKDANLYKVDTSTGSSSILESNNWAGVIAVTFKSTSNLGGGLIYSIHGNNQWKTTTGGVSSVFNSSIGPAISLTNYGANLFSVSGNSSAASLLKISFDLPYYSALTTNWAGTGCITARN